MFFRMWETRVDAPVEKVWELYSSAEVLAKICPPNHHVRAIGPAEVKEGAVHRIRSRFFGLPVTVNSQILQVRPPHHFVDTGKTPLLFWRHWHEFIPDGEGTILRDTIVYRLPFGGKLGKGVNKVVVRKQLDAFFQYRHEATKRALEG